MEVRLVHAGRAKSLREERELLARITFVDELEMISIPDNQARLNALLGGELDAMENLDFTLAKANETNEAIQILNAPGINPVPMVMKQISLHFRRSCARRCASWPIAKPGRQRTTGVRADRERPVRPGRPDYNESRHNARTIQSKPSLYFRQLA